MLVCDGLKGLPDAVNTVWDKTIVQTCVIHLLRNSFKYTSRRDWPELAKDLKPIYTAPSADAALDRFAEFSDKWEKRCPAVIRLWTDAWAEFVPFLEFDVEIRKIICTTNAIWVFDSAGWLGCCYPGQRSRRWALALNANDAVRLSWTRSARAHRMSADAGRLA